MDAKTKPSALMQNYGRLPIAFERGVGIWLEEASGRRYLDALSGIAVCSLGHAHPKLVEAISEQAAQLIHCSNLFQIPLQEKLGEKLCELSGMEAAFFCNSGTEANEAAIKIARKYGHDHGLSNPQTVVTEGSFHGRTLGALAATGNSAAQKGFEPMPGGFIRIPYGDIGALKHLLEDRHDVVAMMIEPIQGEGGVNVPPKGYLKQVRELADKHGFLMMLDEIQTGIGRTGEWFGCQHEEVVPDVMTLAKGLGGGFPIGACLTRGQAGRTLSAGTHGTTFGGNPLACRAALTVLQVLEDDHLISNAEDRGLWMRNEFKEKIGGLDCVKDIRGQGLIIGIELDRPCKELVQQGLDDGIIINVTADSVIRLLPPLILTQDHAAKIVHQVCQLVENFGNQP